MNDFDELYDFDDDGDACATVTMVDDDGTETEFVVISSVNDNGTNYLLVIESSVIDNEEAEATILKEVREDGENAWFAAVDDDEEFYRAIGFFQNSNEDYDIEI